jgi:NAD-dependent deacetylase
MPTANDNPLFERIKGLRMEFPDTLLSTLRAAKHIVIFTGAGVSAESGIPTFRDTMTGLWHRFRAEDMATAQAFRNDPDLVWGWYEWRRMKVLKANPNPAHLAIAAMADFVPKLTVVTQNVDDLHERAGSQGVIHLHGNLHQPRCFACNHPYDLGDSIPNEPEGGRPVAPPRCPRCKDGRIRPGVVWFGESLPEAAFRSANMAACSCDVLFSIGTSAVVYPAAEIPEMAARKGAVVILVNPGETQLDSAVSYKLTGRAGEIIPALVSATW